MPITTLATTSSAPLAGKLEFAPTHIDVNAKAITFMWDIDQHLEDHPGAMLAVLEISQDNGSTWDHLCSAGRDKGYPWSPTGGYGTGKSFITHAVYGVGNPGRMVRGYLQVTGGRHVITAAKITTSSVYSSVGAVGHVTDSAETGLAQVTSATVTFAPGATSTALGIWVGHYWQSGTAPTSFTMTWNGVACSRVSGADITMSGVPTNQNRGSLWQLANPATGSHTLSYSWTNTSDVGICCATFSGTDTTTPFINGTTASGTSTSVSITVTCADGTSDFIAAQFMTNAGTITISTGTELYFDNDNNSNFAGAYRAGAAGSQSITYTASPSCQWTAAGANIVTPQAAGQTPYNRYINQPQLSSLLAQ